MAPDFMAFKDLAFSRFNLRGVRPLVPDYLIFSFSSHIEAVTGSLTGLDTFPFCTFVLFRWIAFVGKIIIYLILLISP